MYFVSTALSLFSIIIGSVWVTQNLGQGAISASLTSSVALKTNSWWLSSSVSKREGETTRVSKGCSVIFLQYHCWITVSEKRLWTDWRRRNLKAIHSWVVSINQPREKWSVNSRREDQPKLCSSKSSDEETMAESSDEVVAKDTDVGILFVQGSKWGNESQNEF